MKNHFADKYVLSCYFVLTVCTTVGFGDIGATNFEEQVRGKLAWRRGKSRGKGGGQALTFVWKCVCVCFVCVTAAHHGHHARRCDCILEPHLQRAVCAVQPSSRRASVCNLSGGIRTPVKLCLFLLFLNKFTLFNVLIVYVHVRM